MEQQLSQTPPVFTPISQDDLVSYSTDGKEIIFAFAMAVCTFCMANFILMGGFSLGFAIVGMASIVLSAGYLAISKKRGTAYSRTILALCLVIAAGFGRSNDAFVKFVLFFFLLVGINLGLCLGAEQNRRSPGSALSLLDAGRSLFSLGFGKMAPSFRGLAAHFRSGSPSSQRTGAILLGAVIAVPVLAVVVPLLIRADAAFDGLVALLPELDLVELGYSALWGSILFCVLYTRSVALVHHKGDDRTFLFGWQLNPLTINTLLVAVCIVYGCYLLSQLAYFVGGFSGILPEGYSASEYARRGFFEMTWLCAINLGIIAFSMGLLDRDEKVPRSSCILCLFIGLVSLFFVAASFAKMGLYISVYGLTRLRVLTMVIMVFLGITVSLVCVRLFCPRLQYMKAVVLTALILGALVIWMDVDTQVARYNVNGYLSGSLDGIDTSHLGGLGDGAVPAIAQLLEAEDPSVAQWAEENLLERHRLAREPEDLRSWNQIQAGAFSFLRQWTREQVTNP